MKTALIAIGAVLVVLAIAAWGLVRLCVYAFTHCTHDMTVRRPRREPDCAPPERFSGIPYR